MAVKAVLRVLVLILVRLVKMLLGKKQSFIFMADDDFLKILPRTDWLDPRNWRIGQAADSESFVFGNNRLYGPSERCLYIRKRPSMEHNLAPQGRRRKFQQRYSNAKTAGRGVPLF
jgi:hypothetical protein